LTLLIFVFSLIYSPQNLLSQDVPENFGNNSTLKWKVVESDHFIITYPEGKTNLRDVTIKYAEEAYRDYHKKLGISPEDKIELYINDEDELTSSARAVSIDSYKSIWHTNAYMTNLTGMRQSLRQLIRYEVAIAFQQKLKASDIGAWQYFFSRPTQDPWSNGLPAYLTEPAETIFDKRWSRSYWLTNRKHISSASEEFNNIMMGRSQLQRFEDRYTADSLSALYNYRCSILWDNVDYFNFDPAFKQVSGQSYNNFTKEWEEKQKSLIPDNNRSLDSELNSSFEFISPGNYTGLKINHNGTFVSTIALPESGRLLQKLTIIKHPNRDSQESTILEKGIFHPKMTWSPTEDQLVYSKRIFGDHGNYHNELFITNIQNSNIHQLTDQKHALLPTFSPDGNQIAYVSKKDGQDSIYLRNLPLESNRFLKAFDSQMTIGYLDWHPSKPILLISYSTDGQEYRLATYNITSNSITDLGIKTQTSVNGQWGGNGHTVYFNGIANGITNIFRATFTGSSLRQITPLTQSYTGIDLLEAIELPERDKMLVARSYLSQKGFSILGFNVDKQGLDNIDTSVSQGINTNDKSTLSAASNSSNSQSNTLYEYNSITNTRFDRAFLLPYYLNPGGYGLFGIIRFIEPMRTHELTVGGTFSAPSFFKKSSFFASYTNNMFRPQLQVNWTHLPAASEWFGKSLETQTSDVVSVKSLWRIPSWSSLTTDWYFGAMVRHMSFDYYSDSSLARHHPELAFKNTDDSQIDLRLGLAWRNYEPYRHNVIHPIDGAGARALFTASDKLLGSGSRFVRLDLTGYKIFPLGNSHTIYLNGRGILQSGESVGRDYIGLTESSSPNFGLPEFLGEESPGVDQRIRGYDATVLGDKLVTGTLEYRIPLRLNSTKRLLGFIPPARTSLAVFTEGGILWDARQRGKTDFTEHRFSTGVEIKRVFRLSDDFAFSYSMGFAKALTNSDSPQFYFGLRSAIPF